MKKIILIDGNSLMFRAYYATSYTGNLMQNSKGLYTNAIYSFCNMINKILSNDYDYVFVAFDAGKATFRHQTYDEYKAGRRKMPDEFRVQIPYIKEFLDIMNVTHLENLDYEADDLVASVSKMASDEHFDDIMIITGDKDLLQLVGGNVHVSLTKKGVSEFDDYNDTNFYEKMGFYPSQIPDYKGLAGDSSDNLPGVSGVGEKTAIKLLNDYQSIEGIYNNINNIKGKLHDTLIMGEATGKMCKKLATLIQNYKAFDSLDVLKRRNPDLNELVRFYKELEFNSFLKKLGEVKEEKKEIKNKDIDAKYTLVDDLDYDFSNIDCDTLILESYGDNYLHEQLVGIALLGTNSLFVTSDVLKNNIKLQNYLESGHIKKTFDYKKAYRLLLKEGIYLPKVDFDLLLAAYLINTKNASEDFKELLDNTSDIKYNVISDKELYDKAIKKNELDLHNVCINAIKKAYIIDELEPSFKDIIINEKLIDLFKMEIALSEVLGDMEISGLYVNIDKLHSVGAIFEDKLKIITKDIYTLAGKEFNINSSKQVASILFDDLKLPLPKGKKVSTSVEILELLKDEHPIVEKILGYRTYSKLMSTYIKGMENVMNEGHFIHPLYKQALTLTGRLSSVEPNIQNMPIRTEEGQVIRDVFASRFDNGKIMSIDYSQIELRLLAHMSGDDVMIDAFNSGEDFHAHTAANIFNCDIKDVTKTMRRYAKAINFGIVYGMSAYGLSQAIDVSPKDAKAYIDTYFLKYKKIDAFLKGIVEEAKTKGYSETMFLRKRYIPELASMNKNIYEFGKRTAMNAPIQGSAADIIKMAMVKVHKAMKDANYKSCLIAQVHDELVFDCVSDEVDALAKLVKDIMENICSLKVKLIAEVSVGDTWLKA